MSTDDLERKNLSHFSRIESTEGLDGLEQDSEDVKFRFMQYFVHNDYFINKKWVEEELYEKIVQIAEQVKIRSFLAATQGCYAHVVQKYGDKDFAKKMAHRVCSNIPDYEVFIDDDEFVFFEVPNRAKALKQEEFWFKEEE